MADAQQAKQDEDDRKAAAEWKAGEAAQRDAETQRLLDEAAAPGTDPAVVVSDVRTAAVNLLDTGGPWTKTVAATALSGDEAGLREFLRSGLAVATEQDDRASVLTLADTSDNERFKQAALAAFAGTYDEVKEFLRTRDYPGKADDDRIAVQLILDNGGPATKDAANKALDGTAEDVAEFLRTGQYVAAEHDDRIAVSQALASGGPEVQAAAQAALDGPASYLRTFLRTEQYTAQQRDIDTAVHNADVHRYVTEAASIAATARANAALAAEAAARARNAADEATQAATEAQNQADQAAIYAQQAADSANQAQQSADQAAESARQARNASNSAQQAAQSAAVSATQARFSAVSAQQSAASAGIYAEQARAAALQAGADAAAAAKAAAEAQILASEALANADYQQRLDKLASGDQTGPLTPEDEAALRAAGGQDLVDRYKHAQEIAGQTVIDWIIANGGQILVDLFIGGIRACLNAPSIVNCIAAAVDVASLGLAAVKAFEVGKALWRVANGLEKFVDELNVSRRTIQEGFAAISEAKNGALDFGGGWVLPREGGGAMINGRWYTQHALERMAPDTPEVRALLESRFNRRVEVQGDELKDPDKYAEFYNKNKPNPRNVPPSVVEAEIQNPGSTGRVKVILNESGDVVTVIIS